MRTCVIGGGLAGSLLAWRLARDTAGRVVLVTGSRRGADATSASGGAVRAYEVDPRQRGLAVASMAELLASATLRRWTDYHEVGSVYLRDFAPVGGNDGVDLRDIEHALPGSAQVVPLTELERLGWAARPGGVCAVVERRAGIMSPRRLRDAVLADRAVRRRVSTRVADVTSITLADSGAVDCVVAGVREQFDTVVIAAGAWTATLLRVNGFAADGYRTKTIQYSRHRTSGTWRPPMFVDEVTGLYGRPTRDGGLLLGLPTDMWDTDPDRPRGAPTLREAALRLAHARFPRLRAGPATAQVVSADCYCAEPVLTLRPVVNTGHRLFTFSGGAGGAAKTALAASQRAATQLAGLAPWPSTPVGR